MDMIKTEFGKPWDEVYAELTPEPIAAASLGQVRVMHHSYVGNKGGIILLGSSR